MVITGEAYGIAVSEQRIAIYAEELQLIPADRLADCFHRARQRSKYFPSISEILEASQSETRGSLLLTAERAWEALLADFREWYFCRVDGHGVRTEVGVKSRRGKLVGPPHLSPATEYALRQVGGYAYVGDCDPEQIRWIRKDFIEAYLRYMETDGLKQLPARFEDMPREIQDAIERVLKPMDSEKKPTTQKELLAKAEAPAPAAPNHQGRPGNPERGGLAEAATGGLGAR
jgi:hypothetical protein